MHFTSLASVGLLASSALALPKPNTAAKKRSTRMTARHFKAEPSLLRRDGRATTPNDGGGWLVSTQVGPSTVTLNIDTGSSDLWVASTLMPPDQQAQVQTGHPVYDPSQSTTAQALDGESYNITYGDNSGASGPEYTETVVIGEQALAGMPIGVCSDLRFSNGAAGTRNSDGPVGLGFQALNTARPVQQPSFAEALIAANALSQPLFTTHFTTDDQGFILFGETDSTCYTDPLLTFPVDNSAGFWNINDVSFGVNGQQFDASIAPITVIADTGGPGLDIPADALSAYFANVDGATNNGGTWQYPCASTLPDINVFVNGGSVAVAGSKLSSGSIDGGNTCVTWLGEANGSGSLGVPFFASMYIEWDVSVPEMRVSRQNGV